MRDKHFKFFIAYTIAALLGMLVCVNGVQNNLILIGSVFLIMAAAVHFKNWKTNQIQEYKKQK